MNNKDNTLSRLIYISKKDIYLDTNDLKEILSKAQHHNVSHEITGLLLFNSRFFLQVLEGPRKSINDLYHKIAQDKRHSSVQLLQMGNITKRQWSQWSMEFISITDIELNIYEQYMGEGEFNPYHLDSFSVDDFLSDVSMAINKA